MGKKNKITNADLPKMRLPKSTRTHQVHKSEKDYDRKDDAWKKENNN
jgi:hypothetical protein